MQLDTIGSAKGADVTRAGSSDPRECARKDGGTTRRAFDVMRATSNTDFDWSWQESLQRNTLLHQYAHARIASLFANEESSFLHDSDALSAAAATETDEEPAGRADAVPAMLESAADGACAQVIAN